MATTSLTNFQETDPKANINSPRSLKACKLEGILPDELVYKPVEHFHERSLSPRLVKLRYDFFEAKRRDLLAAARRQRDTLLAEERRAQETGSRTLDLMPQDKSISASAILAVNSDGLRLEHQKLQKAQAREQAWLKNALNNELRQLKELEEKEFTYSENQNQDAERLREASRRMKALQDRKAAEEERKQLEAEARQMLQKKIAKEEFLKQQQDLQMKQEQERLRVKEAYQRQLADMERKKEIEMEKQAAKERAFQEQEAKKAEMRAQDLKRTDIKEKQKAKFDEMILEKQMARQQRVGLAEKFQKDLEDRRRQEHAEKLVLEKERAEALMQAKAMAAEEAARKGMQQMMRRRVIADEALRKAEERRLNILESQEDTEQRLLEHEQKKERYLDFKRELDGLKERNKAINVERQRRKEAAGREMVANQVRKKDEKIDILNAERKRIWQIRKDQQTEAYKAREMVRSEIMRQRIASKYNSGLLEKQMQQLDIASGMSASVSMPNLVTKPSRSESPTGGGALPEQAAA